MFLRVSKDFLTSALLIGLVFPVGAQAAIKFIPYQDGPPIQFSPPEPESLPIAPYHKRFGDLDFSGFSADQFPLTLRLKYFRIPTQLSVFNPEATIPQKKFSWGDPVQINSDSSPVLGVTREVIFEKKPIQPFPLYDLSFQFPGNPQYSNPELKRLDIEIESKGEIIEERSPLINAYAADFHFGPWSDGALSMEEDQAERVLIDLNYTPIIQTDALFPNARHYAYIKAIWIGPSALNDPALENDFFQRLLLQDIKLVGTKKSIQTLSKRLGIRPDEAVLSSTLQETPGRYSALAFNSGVDYDASSYWPGEEEIDSFNPIPPLAGNRIANLNAYSTIILITFVLLITLFLLWSLNRWRGEKRMKIWLYAPALSVLVAGSCAFLAPLFINHHPSGEAIQTLYSYNDWPDAYQRTSLNSIGLKNEPVTWAFPAGTQVIKHLEDLSRFPILLPENKTFQMKETEEQTLFTSFPNKGRYMPFKTDLWVKNNPPFNWVSSSQIQFNQPYKRAWIWNGEAWIKLGEVKKDDIKTISKTDNAIFNPEAIETENDYGELERDENAPPLFLNNFQPEFSDLPERVRRMTSPDFLKSDRFKRQGILLGLSPEQASARPLWDKGSLFTQSIRVHGFPLQGGSK